MNEPDLNLDTKREVVFLMGCPQKGSSNLTLLVKGVFNPILTIMPCAICNSRWTSKDKLLVLISIPQIHSTSLNLQVRGLIYPC